MNAKVTTWWKNSNDQKATVEMPEHMVADYLAGLPRDQLKGYVVDAAPEIQPRAPLAEDAVTTIFPVPISGKVHAAFVMDYRTDKWATMCGKAVKDAATVEHRVAAVECRACQRQMQ